MQIAKWAHEEKHSEGVREGDGPITELTHFFDEGLNKLIMVVLVEPESHCI